MTGPPSHGDGSKTIRTEAQLRALIGEPAALVCAKMSDRLNPLTRTYIERSPFVCVATSDRDGNCDISPRGDPAGFVRILDDRRVDPARGCSSVVTISGSPFRCDTLTATISS